MRSPSGARLSIVALWLCALAAVGGVVRTRIAPAPAPSPGGGPPVGLLPMPSRDVGRTGAAEREAEAGNADPRATSGSGSAQPSAPGNKNEMAGGERRGGGNATTEVWAAIDARSDYTPRQTGLLKALHWFDGRAAALNITYSLTYGSLLGQIRGGDVIPHDTDADVEVGTDAIMKLEQAMGEDDMYDQADHGEIPWGRPVMLVRLQNHNLTFDRVQRYDCRGGKQATQEDGCAFSGPLARVMFGWHAYVDVFFRCTFVEDAPASWHCRNSTMDCSYCPSGQALRALPFTPVPCNFGPITMRCPPESYAHERLRGVYGNTYMTPDKR